MLQFLPAVKNDFAIAGTTGPNQVLFAAIFLKDNALFRWQQYEHKIEDQTNVPISWEGFKAFFWQGLDKSEAFVNTIRSTNRNNSQHQLEEVIDWAAHLKHLQTNFCKFDADVVILEPVLICLFHHDLRPSICAQAKQKGRRKDT